jgi:hypothetical protein
MFRASHFSENLFIVKHFYGRSNQHISFISQDNGNKEMFMPCDVFLRVELHLIENL